MTMRLQFRSHLFLSFAAATVLLPASPATAAGREVVVTISQMRYAELPAGLKAGDTIVWKNMDGVPHTVTARDKSFDLRLNPRQSSRMTLTKAGSHPFYCIYHVQMRGTLNVGK